MSWLGSNTAVAALLALAVLAVGRLLRPSPAAMHGLWLLVLLKLALPPLFELPLPWAWPAAAPAVAVVDLGAAPTAVPGAVAADAGAAWLGTGELLLLLWAFGTAVATALTAAGAVHGHRRVRALAPAPAWLQREVAALAQQLGMRAPRAFDDPSAHAPCVFCLFGTRLLLPAAVLARTPPKGRAAVLAHELAHLRRGDHLVAQLELVLALLLWWHPLFWFARARLRLWAELACDAWAVAAVPGAALDYAGVLIDAVAAPGPAIPGLTVLAARPAARAAFERRLTMILNEKVACRCGRGWWLPFAALGLGLLGAPVLAQQPREPVRVEIKVNGKDLGELTPAERRAALRLLLRQSGDSEPQASDEPQEAKPEAPPKPKPKAKQGKAQKPKALQQRHGDGDGDAKGLTLELLDEKMPSAAELRQLIDQGLQQAKIEVLDDADLKRLGIQDEVGKLIDSIGKGEGLQGSLDALIQKAMRGAGKQAIAEIHGDVDLKQLGIDGDLGELIERVMNDAGVQKAMSGLGSKALRKALQDAKVEVLDDDGLKQLGVQVDVGNLLEHLLDGKGDGNGEFGTSLQQLIDKAVRAAQKTEARQRDRDAHDDDEDEAPPPPKKAKKGKTKIV